MDSGSSEANVVRIKLRPDVSLKHDKRVDGWKYLRDVNGPTADLDLELVGFVKKEEMHISEVRELVKIDDPLIQDKALEEMLVERAKQNDALLGQRHAEALLENQNDIIEQWNSYCLVLPETVCIDLGWLRRVPCLCCYGPHRWRLEFLYIRHVFRPSARFVRIRR